MPKFNDFDLDWENWKQLEEIYTDSLWVINERDKSGKHSNFYHGNFIPQIPNQLIQRYTKKGDYVLDMFVWSGTTAIEAEKLWRNVIGVDIQPTLIERLDNLIDDNIKKKFIVWDSSTEKTTEEIEWYLKTQNREWVDLVLLHPPYFDIIKFSQEKNDLSNTQSIKEFIDLFGKVLENSKKLLKKWGYLAIVMWDKYQNSEWIPLWFYCMHKAQKVGLQLKSIIVKNMEWNRGKLGSGWIRRYRALSSDYYIFKHEYIFILKK